MLRANVNKIIFWNCWKALITMEPLPLIQKYFSLIIQQERTHPVSITPGSVTESSNMAMVVETGFGSKRVSVGTNPNTVNNGRSRPNTRGNQGTSRYCTHCGHHNHTIDTCYAKHGYPPGYPNFGKPSQNCSINNTTKDHERPSESTVAPLAQNSSTATSIS